MLMTDNLCQDSDAKFHTGLILQSTARVDLEFSFDVDQCMKGAGPRKAGASC